MNSFIHLLLFTVFAAVLFASSDPMVAAAPAGEVPSEPSKGNGIKRARDLLDLLPGKDDKNKPGVDDVVNNVGTQLKGGWSGLQEFLSSLKAPKVTF